MKKKFFKATDKRLFCFLITVLLCSGLLLGCIPLASAEIQVTPLGNYSFIGNDVDSQGALWVGDKNFGLWKSIDNGASFQLVYKMPGTVDSGNIYGGLVWTVFVDSRDYIFVSAGGTGGLFRSIDRGATFTQILKTNGTTNESFYISMTEDDVGSLYVVTYTSGRATPYMLKSVDGGTTWVRIGNFGVFHFHTIKFNPYNHYLYVIIGEGSNPDAARILRSKDGGASWSLLVKRNDNVGTVYLGLAFNGNYVYLGQDYPNRVCNIQRFYDDGSNSTFDTQTVYTPPSDGYMPFISATNLGDSLVFANCAEQINGVSRVVASNDGVNWNVLKTQNVTSADNRWNFLTVHPRSGFVFGTIKPGESYRLNYVAPTPTASPYVEPTPRAYNTPKPSTVATAPTPKPTSSPTPTPTSTPTQTPQPTNSTSPTPASTLAHSSTFRIDPYLVAVISAAAIMGSVLVTTVLLKRKQHNHD